MPERYPVLPTRVEPSSELFLKNVEIAERELGTVAAAMAKARSGGGEKYQRRHLEAGKLLPRQRVELLLDPGAYFLELCPLAGHDVPQESTGAGVIEIKVTVSVGVATADIRDRQGVNLVSRADAALYAAKHAGRNRVEIAAPPVGLAVPAL